MHRREVVVSANNPQIRDITESVTACSDSTKLFSNERTKRVQEIEQYLKNVFWRGPIRRCLDLCSGLLCHTLQ